MLLQMAVDSTFSHLITVFKYQCELLVTVQNIM